MIDKIALSALLASSIVGTALADATVTATGSAYCYDGTTQTYFPLAGARVELMDSDCDGSQICDDEMGRSYVQDDGSYSVTGSGGDPGIFWTDPDVYVRFAYNDDQGVRLTDEADSTRSWSTPEHDHNDFGGGKIDFGAWSTGNGVGAGEGTQCGVWRKAHLAYAAYKIEIGATPPAGHLDVEYWSAIWAGTPWTNTDTIHWPIHYGTYAVDHEFGHSIRHAADGDAGHFSWDVTRFQYARSHSMCAGDANRNPSEADESLRGYGFNEGWAEYWEGRVSGCGASIPPDEFHEGTIARSLHLMQEANNLTRKDMVLVLTDHPGAIHTLGEFQSQLAQQLGVASLGLNQSGMSQVSTRVEADRAPFTEIQRQRAIEAQLGDIRAQIARLRAERNRYAQLDTRLPPAQGHPITEVPPEKLPCHGADCNKLFQRLIAPPLLDAQARALELQGVALQRARSAEWPAQVQRAISAGQFDAWLANYRASFVKSLQVTMSEALARAEKNVREMQGSLQPEALAAFEAELAQARGRLSEPGAMLDLRLTEDMARRLSEAVPLAATPRLPPGATTMMTPDGILAVAAEVSHQVSLEAQVVNASPIFTDVPITVSWHLKNTTILRTTGIMSVRLDSQVVAVSGLPSQVDLVPDAEIAGQFTLPPQPAGVHNVSVNYFRDTGGEILHVSPSGQIEHRPYRDLSGMGPADFQTVVDVTKIDSDGDGINDALETQLLARFTPFLKFSRDGGSDDYRPMDALNYVRWSELQDDSDEGEGVLIHNAALMLNPNLVLSQGTNITTTKRFRPDRYINPQADVPQPGGNWARHGYAWNDVLANRNIGLYGHVVPFQATKLYTDVLHCSPSSGSDKPADWVLCEIDLDPSHPRTYYKVEYWQFFGYNGGQVGIGDHEGDWCTVQVLVDAETTAPVQVHMFAHGWRFGFDLQAQRVTSQADLAGGTIREYRGVNGGRSDVSFTWHEGPVADNENHSSMLASQANVLWMMRDEKSGEYAHPVVFVENSGHEFWPTAEWSFLNAHNHDGDDAANSYLAAPPPNLGEVSAPLNETPVAEIVLRYNGRWGTYSRLNSPPQGPPLHNGWTWEPSSSIRWLLPADLGN